MFKKLMCVVVVTTAATAYSQENTRASAFDVVSTNIVSKPAPSVPEKRLVIPFADRYYDQADGISEGSPGDRELSVGFSTFSINEAAVYRLYV